MTPTPLVSFAKDTPSLVSALRRVLSARMPEDAGAIRAAVRSVPYRYQGPLKGLACWLTYRRTGVNYPHSVAIDTTLACNFACPHCYLADDLFTPSKENIEKGLSLDAWEARLRQLTDEHPFLLHASWLGGEPLLRRDLILRGSRYFNFNWVHTNGYLGFPLIGDVEHPIHYVVSIDGYREHHDRMRPARGNGAPTYQRVLDNLRNSTGPKITVHTVVSPDNLPTLGDMIQDVRATGRVDRLGFSLESPEWGSTLFSARQRDAVVERLMGYRRQYGRFIWSTPSMLKSMRAARVQDTYGRGCLLRLNKQGISSMIPLTNYGEVKKQCVMGPEHSCDECACAIPALYRSIFAETGMRLLESTPGLSRAFDYV